MAKIHDGQVEETGLYDGADGGLQRPQSANSSNRGDADMGATMTRKKTESGDLPITSRVSSFFHFMSLSDDDDEDGQKTEQQEEVLTNDSIFAKIALDDNFQNFTLGVIVVNALWIGIDTDWNHSNLKKHKDDKAPLAPVSTIIENLFCIYFTFEVVVRFLAFRRKIFCFRDGWFIFDSILVFCMVMETWVMAIVEAVGGGGGSSALSNFSALRLLRLLRLTRMARIMQAVPELMMLVKGMVSSVKSVGWILIFLVLVMYVFAILMLSIIAKPPPEGEEWPDCDAEAKCAKYVVGSMGDAMMTLYTNGVLGDNLAQIVDILVADGIGSMWIFWVFFGISSMTLLNMLIGVLCEVITSTAEDEKAASNENSLRATFIESFNKIDVNKDGKVSLDEWEKMKTDEDIRRKLAIHGVDPETMDEELEKMKTAIFCSKVGQTRDDFALTLDEFVEKLIDIQPVKYASVLELSLLKSKFEMRSKKMQGYATLLEDDLQQVLQARGVKYTDTSRGSTYNSDNPLCSVSTEDLFAALKRRSSPDPPRADSYEEMYLQSAFPTPEAEESDEMNDPDDSERLVVSQHPLFKELRPRKIPGGWNAARSIATLLEKKQMTLQDLSCESKKYSTSDIQKLLDAVPELFEQDRINETVSVHCPEVHVQGCPKHELSSAAVRDHPCQCVWRLSDALYHFTEKPPKSSKKTFAKAA